MNPHHITQACRRTQDALLIATEKPSPKPQNGGGGGSSIEPPTPLPVTLISAKRELADWLQDWCSMVRDGLGVVANYDLDEHSRLQWLGSGERAEFLAAHETAQDFLDELTAITRSLESPYIPRAGKKYIGNYGGGAVFIREGQRTVELADGTEVPVIDINDTNTDMILNKTGTTRQVSNIIKAYFKINIDPKRIHETAKNDKRKRGGEKLEPIRKDGDSNIYRVEHVLNRLGKKEISPNS